jgi:hypothetical protein
VDWQPNKMELQRGAVATAPSGKQNLELLPNATGIACQDVRTVKGARYRLSFYYGLLRTTAWRPPYVGQVVAFHTKAAAAVRDAGYAPPRGGAKPGVFPKDAQGFEVLVEADTSKQASQWQRYEVEFAAPAARTTLAFVTTKRPPECGSCGSLLDAVCLQKGECEEGGVRGGDSCVFIVFLMCV